MVCRTWATKGNILTMESLFANRIRDYNGLVLQVSISPRFYEQLLHMQIPKAQKRLTTWLNFFVLLWSTHTKAAHKMLGKSTPGVNFTNSSFFILEFFCTGWLCNFFWWENFSQKTVGKIDYWCQFHQHFTSRFFVWKCFTKLFCA